VQESATRDFLLFNLKDDRREALELARTLRGLGFTAARDIIRRGMDESLAYARRVRIRFMVVIGDDDCRDDEVKLIRVADGSSRIVSRGGLQEAVAVGAQQIP
jgi:ATP phosphoribosyltransferase regulatory subunit